MDENAESADKYVPKDETSEVFPLCMDYTSENDKYEGPFNRRIPYDDNDSSTLTDEEFAETTTTDELETKQPPPRLKRLFKYPVLVRQIKSHFRIKNRLYIKKLIQSEMTRFQENIIKTLKKYQNMGRLDRINKCVKSNEKQIGNKLIANWSHDKQLTCPINVFRSRRKMKTIGLHTQLSPVYQTEEPLGQSCNGMDNISMNTYMSKMIAKSNLCGINCADQYLSGRQSTNGVHLSTPAKHNLASSLRSKANEPHRDHVIREIRLATELKKMNKQSVHIILQGFRPFSDMISNRQINIQTQVARHIDFKSGEARKLYFQSGLVRQMDFQSELVEQINSQTGVFGQRDFQTKEVKRLNFQKGVEHMNFQTGVVRGMYFQSEVAMQIGFVTGEVRQMDFQTGFYRQIDFQTGVAYQMHLEAGVMCLVNSQSRAGRQLNSPTRIEHIEFNTGVIRHMYFQSEGTNHIRYETGVVGKLHFQPGVVWQIYFQTGLAKQMHFHEGIVSLIDFRSGAVRQLQFLTTVEQIDFQTGVVRQMQFQSEISSQINFQTKVARLVYFQIVAARQIGFQTGVVKKIFLQLGVTWQMNFQPGEVSLIQNRSEIVLQMDFQREVGKQMEMNIRTGTARQMNFHKRVDRKSDLKTRLVRHMEMQTDIAMQNDFQAVIARQIDFHASAARQMFYSTEFVGQTNLIREVVRKIHFRREVSKQTDCDIQSQHCGSRHTSGASKPQSKISTEKKKHKSFSPTKDVTVRKLQKKKVLGQREHDFAHINRQDTCEDTTFKVKFGGRTQNGTCRLLSFPLKLVSDDIIAQKRSESDELENKIKKNVTGSPINPFKGNSSSVHVQLIDSAPPINELNEQQERRHIHRTVNPGQRLNAGIIDHLIRYVSCNSETDIPATNRNGNEDHFFTTRVIDIHRNKRPVQQCTSSVNTTSDLNGVIKYIQDEDTWIICTSVTRYKPSPNDNKILYRLPPALRLPPEGATVGFILMRNTCSIDGFLVAVFIELHFNSNLREKFRTSGIKIDKLFYTIWKYFLKGEFSKGKIAWCKFGEMINDNCKEVNLEGTERERVFKAFNKNPLLVESRCTNNDCSWHNKSHETHSVLVAFGSSTKSLEEEIKTTVQTYIEKKFGCCGNIVNGKSCRGNRIKRIIDPPSILAVNLYHLRRSGKLYSSKDVPDKIQCSGCIYDLKLVRFYINGHFVEKLKVLGDWTYYDNKDPRLYYFDRDPDSAELSSCVYVKRC